VNRSVSQPVGAQVYHRQLASHRQEVYHLRLVRASAPVLARHHRLARVLVRAQVNHRLSAGRRQRALAGQQAQAQVSQSVAVPADHRHPLQVGALAAQHRGVHLGRQVDRQASHRRPVGRLASRLRPVGRLASHHQPAGRLADQLVNHRRLAGRLVSHRRLVAVQAGRLVNHHRQAGRQASHRRPVGRLASHRQLVAVQAGRLVNHHRQAGRQASHHRQAGRLVSHRRLARVSVHQLVRVPAHRQVLSRVV